MTATHSSPTPAHASARAEQANALAQLHEENARLHKENAQLREELTALRGLAFRDQLTGLYSRRYLTEYLEREIEDRSAETSVVLALCDIDDFKNINDARGHRAGDITIVCIADILDDLAADQPVIRWGGEELLIVLFSMGVADALRLCEEIRTQVAAYRINDGYGEFSCTLTFGVGAFDPEFSFAENFARIDRALYRGKETGKNCCVLAHPAREEGALA